MYVCMYACIQSTILTNHRWVLCTNQKHDHNIMRHTKHNLTAASVIKPCGWCVFTQARMRLRLFFLCNEPRSYSLEKNSRFVTVHASSLALTDRMGPRPLQLPRDRSTQSSCCACTGADAEIQRKGVYQPQSIVWAS
jgi:hypothetical protein